MDKKNITLWALYDLANSMVVIVFAIYFPQWLVVTNHISDFWYNLIFVAASFLFIVTAPIFAARADRRGVNLPYLRVLTFLQFLSMLAIGALAVFFPNTHTNAVIAAFLFMLGSYFYQFALVFYNALLPQLTERRGVEIISSIGEAGKWLGQIVGLVITLPLAGGAIYLFGNHGSVQVFIPTTLLFILITLPMLIFFKEREREEQEIISIKDEYKKAFSLFVDLMQTPTLGTFLLGYFFFSDAMLTVVNNFPIFVERIYHVSDATKGMLAIGILVTAFVGALLGGRLAQWLGLKRALVAVISCWFIFYPLVALLNNLTYFVIVLCGVGLLYGATFTISRACMAVLTPPEKVNHSFSYYTLAERFSTFIGPLAWGIIIYSFGFLGVWRYRLAVLGMAVFVLIGLLIIRKVKISNVVPKFET